MRRIGRYIFGSLAIAGGIYQLTQALPEHQYVGTVFGLLFMISGLIVIFRPQWLTSSPLKDLWG